MEESFDGTDITVRHATRADIPAIVHLLEDDPLGQQRERDQVPPLDAYYDAFARIDGDPRNELIVVEAHGEVVGTLQLTLLPYLTYQGGMRAQIEAVRVDRRYRSQRLGHYLFVWAIVPVNLDTEADFAPDRPGRGGRLALGYVRLRRRQGPAVPGLRHADRVGRAAGVSYRRGIPSWLRAVHDLVGRLRRRPCTP